MASYWGEATVALGCLWAVSPMECKVGEYRVLHVSLIREWRFSQTTDVFVGLFISLLVSLFRFKALLSSKPTNDSTCIEIGYVKYPIFQVRPCRGLERPVVCAGHRASLQASGCGLATAESSVPDSESLLAPPPVYHHFIPTGFIEHLLYA